jgi:hypothetical protein
LNISPSLQSRGHSPFRSLSFSFFFRLINSKCPIEIESSLRCLEEKKSSKRKVGSMERSRYCEGFLEWFLRGYTLVRVWVVTEPVNCRLFPTIISFTSRVVGTRLSCHTLVRSDSWCHIFAFSHFSLLLFYMNAIKKGRSTLRVQHLEVLFVLWFYWPLFRILYQRRNQMQYFHVEYFTLELAFHLFSGNCHLLDNLEMWALFPGVYYYTALLSINRPVL